MIYVLTDGTYSDYHIVCVTEDYEIADAYSKLHGYNIEEFEPVTDKSIIRKYEESIIVWKFFFNIKGEIKYFAEYGRSEERKQPFIEIKEYPIDDSRGMYVLVFENDIEKAKKIAIDARAKYLSEMFGL